MEWKEAWERLKKGEAVLHNKYSIYFLPKNVEPKPENVRYYLIDSEIPNSHESDLDSFDTTMSVSWKEFGDDS